MILAVALGVFPARGDGTNDPAATPATNAPATNAAPATNVVPATNAPATQAPDSSASTNAASAGPEHPFIAPDSAAAALFDRPELKTSPPPPRPSLLLNPGDSSSANPPEVSAPGSSFSFDAFRESTGMDWPDDLASHLLVVYNSNDEDSKDLADYYASKRNIPAERVLAIACPLTEEISRADYDKTIRVPILSYLSLKNWISRRQQRVQVGNRMLDLLVATRNDIWAIVLMRGVPLKIANDPDDYFGMEHQAELQTNAAAVDSELALLPIFGLPLGGYVPNIFYESQMNGVKHVGAESARSIILVTRLDGPKVSDVKRMIDDCLEAEKHRLAGLAVVDTRGMTNTADGYTSGDVWLRGARDALVKDGWPLKFDDKPELLPPTDPCNQVAIYLGWYSGDAYGPWVTPPDRFVPGAIAYHLHSFSANTLRSETSNWVGPLIAHGADATMGMVYEPYLALTPHEDIFTRRLLAGDYFCEAAYAAERGLSWMLTVVGDPLYRPFHEPIEAVLADAPDKRTSHEDWLLLQKVQRQIVDKEIEPTPEILRKLLDAPGTGPVAWEGLGDLLAKAGAADEGAAAERAWRKAAVAETQPIDRIRVALKLAQYYRDHGQEAHAQAELDNLRELFPDDARRFGVPNTLIPTSMPTPPAPPHK